MLSLRNEQKYSADTQELEARIQALKKETYDIQSVDLSKREPIIAGETAGLRPLVTLSANNKFITAGEKHLLSNYVPGTEIG